MSCIENSLPSHAASIVAATKKRVTCGSAVGITAFISSVLRGGVGAYSRSVGNLPAQKQNYSSANGLRTGRKLDSIFQQCAKTGSTAGQGKRIRSVFKVLASLRIKIVATQTCVVDKSVGDSKRGIKTNLDGLGITGNGTFVVIELKSTQRTLLEHKKTYKTPCLRHPRMTNGLENSEFVSHQLQAGFGMRAFTNLHAPKHPVAGLVIVSCRDGKSAFYHVSPDFSRASHFRIVGKLMPQMNQAKQSLLCEISLDDARVQAAIGHERIVLSADKRVAKKTSCTNKITIFCLVSRKTPKYIKAAANRLRKTKKAHSRIILFPCRGKYKQLVLKK